MWWLVEELLASQEGPCSMELVWHAWLAKTPTITALWGESISSHYYYYYYYYTIWMSLVTGLVFLVLLLNQRWFPPLRLQASHCSTFPIMCDVPSIAVFCSESIECFLGKASKFFLKFHVTIPVAPIITGTIVHFRFHIRCITNSCILTSFPLPFAQHFCLQVLPHLSVCMFVLLLLLLLLLLQCRNTNNSENNGK